jgi:hypothetical protein
MIYNCSDFCRIRHLIILLFSSFVTIIQNIDYMIEVVYSLLKELKYIFFFDQLMTRQAFLLIWQKSTGFFFSLSFSCIAIVTRKKKCVCVCVLWECRTLTKERKKKFSKPVLDHFFFFFLFLLHRLILRRLLLLSNRSQNTYSDGRNLRTMLFPSSRPPRIPLSPMDSRYDSMTAYPSSSYTRWSRSPAKTSNNRRTANSTSSRRYQYQNVPFSDTLHNQYARQQHPIYSPISPRESLLNNLTT